MDFELLRHVGNISQIAGIQESTIKTGRGKGLDIARFYNAAGLNFTVCPDRCMDIMDMSYKGVNLSFQSKNGPLGKTASPLPEEFQNQWPGGMLVTCGLDNVGRGYLDGEYFPTHGRISSVPAEHFGTRAEWEDDDYVLSAKGEMHQTRLYGRHLMLSREIRTTLNGTSVTIHDKLTNMQPKKEPFMLLYHVNFGYPLLTGKSRVYTSPTFIAPRNIMSMDHVRMTDPKDDIGEELYIHRPETENAWAALVNPEMALGAYIAFNSYGYIHFFAEWKNMRSHDYVLAFEPCNCFGEGRNIETKKETISSIEGYSTLNFEIKIGVLDGDEAIAEFLKQ
ncbi:MAG: aldose 1-epimerase family protein [Clostridia bacterium]|nr:aldose 1-epimerase family protein [Clostridia bacterium]